ncbi:3-oxo-tetronate kinase [Arthrobacter sp. NPDC056727]|uniref:3-oxo-tetronate kinase n=1 Tax=Arthrobacter sp. NPDC056727 TaxID=3345927 RepID=UPI00366AF1EE
MSAAAQQTSGRRPVIGVIADDVTGGTDVAVALRRRGLRTLLFFGTPEDDLQLPEHDALVISLKTRMLPAIEAVDFSLEASRWLQQHGATQTYFKYCSTFDSTAAGNIGPVLDALSDALGAGTVVNTPSSPEHGRTQYEGQLFVGDLLLAESHMRHHPLTPMTDSDLRRLLGQQTHRPVGLLRHETIRSGVEAIGAGLKAAGAEGARYVFADAVSDSDLADIGRAVLGEPLVGGAAGLAGGIAVAYAEVYGTAGTEGIDEDHHGPSAVVAGSCSARTLEQIEHMHRAGRPSFFLDAVATPDAAALAAEALAWYDSLDPAASPLIYSSVEPVRLSMIQSRLGVDGSAAILEEATGLIARGLLERGVTRIIAAGGETSGAVVDALGVSGGLVGAEAARGVPWIHTTGNQSVTLLLKSGNFGDPELLVRASAPTAALAAGGTHGRP